MYLDLSNYGVTVGYGHVPHTGFGSVQATALVAKLLGVDGIPLTHHPLKS